MNKILPIAEAVSMLRRRLLVFALIAITGTVISFFYALGLPKLYATSAVIQIQTSAVSDSLVSGGDSSRALQQLQRTEQRLMARDHLIGIINKYNLFSDIPGASINDKVYWLRVSTQIEQVTNPTLQWRTDISPTALTITVQLGDPVQVADVANEFVTSVLEQSRQQREDRVREALEFFESEETRVGREITALDTEIAAFKRLVVCNLLQTCGLIPKVIDQTGTKSLVVLEFFVEPFLLENDSIVNAGRSIVTFILAIANFVVINLRPALHCRTKIVANGRQIQFINLPALVC